MCRDASRRQFDVVMAWSVDRLGRSLQDLVGFRSELHALGVDLFLHQQGLDTTTPGGKGIRRRLITLSRRSESSSERIIHAKTGGRDPQLGCILSVGAVRPT